MTLTEIKKLTKSGESECLEFKSSTSLLKRACETICGFLNHQGGVVLVGVNDRGELLGQTVSDATRQEIAHELGKFEPVTRVEVKYFFLNKDRKKQVIALKVGSGEHKPYLYDGRPYDRVETTTKRMPQTRYHQLVAQGARLNHSWESFEAEKYTLADLDKELIAGIVRKAIEIKRLPETALTQDLPIVLERLKLLENGRLNNAAVVLFAKDPQYPQCQLKVARFKGNNRQEFLDSNIVYGNVFELLEAAMQFVRRHLPVAAKIVEGQLERVETPLIPFKAVREAMINALSHRDYSVYGGSIGLAIYDEFLEIFNNGGLLPGVTLSQIKSGVSVLRNPKIAEVLYKCDLIEKWGRGIQEIISKCMNAGDPEPEFLVDESQFKVIFRFPSSLKPPVLLIGERENISEGLSRRQQEILALLKEFPELKAMEILEKLSIPPAKRTLRDDLNSLKTQGYIASKGHAKTAVWFLVKK